MSGERATSATERDCGFAILVVLWTLVLVALLATQVTGSGRLALQVSSNLRVAAMLEAAADGAVHEAAFRLLDTSQQGWRADGSVRVLPLPGDAAPGEVSVLLEDQAGKVNPNLASPELLAALLRQLGADTQRAAGLAAAIADWRSTGMQGRPNGTGAAEYRAAGLAYGPPNAPFESSGELASVLGMTPDLLARLLPHVSLFHLGDPDPALATSEVRQALRAVFGAQRLAASAPGGPRTVAVTATARRAGTDAAGRVDGANFTRRAILRIGEGSGGRAWQVLAWGGSES